MRILLTGSSGLVGAAAVAPLLAAGHDVVLLGRRASPAADAGRCSLVRADLLADDASDLAISARPDAIVHCAAAIPTTHTGDAALQAAAQNRRMDEAMLAAATALGAPIVYCSSASVYAPGDEPVTERTSPAPRGAYAEAKLRSETRFLEAAPGVVALRITAPYGRPTTLRTVLQHFTGLALQGEPLRYHGSGSREQDFVHVDDVAAAIVQALGRPAERLVVNVASGRAVTMRQLAELVVSATGSSSPVGPSGQADPQEGQPARFSIALGERTLGWVPRVSLADGVARLAAELRARPS